MAATSPQPQVSSKRLIGRFEVIGSLGSGAQGTVYLASDPELSRKVAIKTLKGQRGRFAELLAGEARTVSKLQHPNIIPVFDLGEQNGIPYVVYAYVPGHTLKEKLATLGTIPPHQAIKWTRQILEALSHAHAQGIVHRDLNPANIQIDEMDNAQVMDFGIATLVGTSTASSEGVWGTLNYLAPESLNGGTLTPGTDLFAMGLVLYEMLTGSRAFEARDSMAVMYKVANQAVPSILARRTDIEPELDAIVQRAVQKKPGDRYQHAKEMLDELQYFMERKDESEDSGEKGSTLNFLLRRMQRKSDFPAISRHVTELSKKTELINETQISEVANLILEDYALTTKLLKLSNSSFYGQYGGKISTVSRAIVILGFKQVRMAALSLLLFEHIGDKPQANELKEVGGLAFLSAVIGRGVARQFHADAEQIFVCAMFHTLGKYLAVYYFPEEYQEIQQVISHKGLKEEAACRSVLGLSYEEIGLGVAKEWQLPMDIQASMHVSRARQIAAAGSSSERVAHIAGFSNEMAAVLTDDSIVDKQEAMAGLCKRYGKSVKVKSSSLDGIIHDALEDMSAYAAVIGVDFQNSRIFRSAMQAVGDNSPGADTAASRALGNQDGQAAAMEPQESSQNILLNGIQDISQAVLDNTPVNDILAMVLETIFRGMAFTRVMFLVRDVRKREMVARFALGKDIERLLPQFHFSVAKQPDLFCRSVTGMNDIVYSMGQGGKMTDIPGWYKNLISTNQLVLYPIVLQNICLGMIYADREDPRQRVTETEQNYLNTLRNQAALAIRQHS